MAKVKCWGISIDRPCHIYRPDRTANCFDLNYPEDTLYIYQKDIQSNLFLDSIEFIWYPNNDRIDM